MYWFDCDMPNTFVCAGVFNNERDKVGDCMTNYSEFKNLNRYQVKLLETLEREFSNYPYAQDDLDWDLIVNRGAFYNDFLELCEDVACWYNQQRSAFENAYDCWKGKTCADDIRKQIIWRYKEDASDEKASYRDHKEFFKSVNIEWESVYGK